MGKRLLHGGVEVIRRTAYRVDGGDMPYARSVAEAEYVVAVRPEVERITKKGETIYQSYLDVGMQGLPAVHEIQKFREAHRWGRDYDTEHRLRARKEGDQLTTTFTGWHNVEAWILTALKRLLVHANIDDFADWNEYCESPRMLGVPSPWICHYFSKYLFGLELSSYENKAREMTDEEEKRMRPQLWMRLEAETSYFTFCRFDRSIFHGGANAGVRDG